MARDNPTPDRTPDRFPDRSPDRPQDRPPEQPPVASGQAPAYALCGRPIPPGVPQSLHHLIPKLRGGKGGPTVLLHQICHTEIHASLTETELARSYTTPEALKTHPRLARFIDWVRKRPPEFRSRSHGGRRKR